MCLHFCTDLDDICSVLYFIQIWQISLRETRSYFFELLFSNEIWSVDYIIFIFLERISKERVLKKAATLKFVMRKREKT